MPSLIRNLVKGVGRRQRTLGSFLLIPYRAIIAFRYYLPKLAQIARWLWVSREVTNFTYDLTAINEAYLAHCVSIVTGVSVVEVQGYIREAQSDTELRTYLIEQARLLANSSTLQLADQIPRFGRRLGWYAVVRAVKPRVVVETGIDKGLGAVLLCSALLRNASEGSPGKYYGTDINMEAGYLLGGKYADVGTTLYGDSIDSLSQLHRIDVFINDSDHSTLYESREYLTVASKLTLGAILLSDNAHVTNALLKFAESTSRRFLFFREEPEDHWYPGGGIGFCFDLPTVRPMPLETGHAGVDKPS